MGKRHSEWAIAVEVGSSSERLTLMILNARADDFTGICWPSVAYISAKSMLDKKTVTIAIAALVKRGLIVKSKRPQSNANQYTLQYKVPAPVEEVDPETARPKNGSTQFRVNPKTGQWSTQKRVDGQPENGSTVNPNLGHESVNESVNESFIGASASQTLPDVPFDDVLFDEARSMGSEPNVEITIEAPAPAPQKRKAAPRRRPATPCPFGPDASIPPEYLEIAQKAGIGDPQQVFSAFVNHALAHDRRLVIWPAGFRTWCSNELKWHPDQKPKPKPLHQRTADDYNW